MAHNSRRKEIIFMGKIRWIRACALLIMTAAFITACGRGNGNNMTTAPDTGSGNHNGETDKRHKPEHERAVPDSRREWRCAPGYGG